MILTEEVALKLAQMSYAFDHANNWRDPEALTWGRLSKVSEECGEVIEAFIGYTGQNPRKGVTHSSDQVNKELLDVAATALMAYEHMTGNRSESLEAFFRHVNFLHIRAAPFMPK